MIKLVTMENISVPTKTNSDVLDWINQHKEKSQQDLLEEAKIFFGSFNGGKKKLSQLVEKLKAENKRRKNAAHRKLMKQCGGGGVTGYIPPKDYIPKCFAATDTCNICEEQFNTNSDLRDHIRSKHTDYVKKCWSMEAFESVTLCEEYENWLKAENNIETDKIMEERKELEKGNKILRERNQNLANTQDTFIKVSQKGNILETRREIFTQNKDGKLKKSVLTEQFANITKGKTMTLKI